MSSPSHPLASRATTFRPARCTNQALGVLTVERGRPRGRRRSARGRPSAPPRGRNAPRRELTMLVERARDEVGELHLDDRPQPHQRHPVAPPAIADPPTDVFITRRELILGLESPGHLEAPPCRLGRPRRGRTRAGLAASPVKAVRDRLDAQVNLGHRHLVVGRVEVCRGREDAGRQPVRGRERRLLGALGRVVQAPLDGQVDLVLVVVTSSRTGLEPRPVALDQVLLGPLLGISSGRRRRRRVPRGPPSAGSGTRSVSDRLRRARLLDRARFASRYTARTSVPSTTTPSKPYEAARSAMCSAGEREVGQDQYAH